MRIHANQFTQIDQLNALNDMQKAAAKKETDRVRKKLLNFSAELDNVADSCVVKVEAREESQQQAKRQNQQNEPTQKKTEERTDSEDADSSISDWA